MNRNSNNIVPIEEIEFISGFIEEAHYCIARPKKLVWNQCLLIHCHGYRPEGTERKADLDVTHGAFNKLIENGWIIVMTSYRREGIIIQDAIKDVHNLRNIVVCEFGIPLLCLIEGRSMGGCIATHIAELENVEKMYDGILAIGAALLAKDPKSPKNLQNNPKVPILYLMNTSEMGPIESYISACKSKMRNDDRIITPALWEISREGHNWVNEEERYDAIHNLMEWIHYKTFITRRTWNNTVFKNPVSSVDWIYDEKGKLISAKALITSITIHGSFRTNLIAEDLKKLNIKHNGSFTMELKDKIEKVVFGFYPFVGIPENSWVCFEDPDGFLMFSILTFRYKNYIQEIGIKVDDSLLLRL